MSSKQKGLLIVISAPSGCGKTTVVKGLLKKRRMGYSISATTRGRREGERHGRDYFFVTEQEFKRGIKGHDFLEWAEVFGNYYGTPKKYIEKLRSQGKDVILDIDVQGAQQLMKKGADAVYIFMLPPSLPELQRRLLKRRTDTRATINKRLALARKEIGCAGSYDYIVVNKKILDTIETIGMIIKSEKYKSERNKEVVNALHTT